MSKHRVKSSSSTKVSGNKKSGSLPIDAVEYLKAWMMSPEHIAHPYPTDVEKVKIMEETGIELKQLTNWFVNNRKRYWKPRVEAQIQERGPEYEVVQPSKKSAFIKSTSSTETVLKPSTHKLPSSPSSKVSKVVNILNAISTDENIQSPDIIRPLESWSTSTSVSDLSNIADSNEVSYELYNQADNVFATSLSFVSDTESGIGMNHHLDDDDPCDPTINKHDVTEFLDVHVLRPQEQGVLPTLLDMSVLPHLPPSRVLKTFKNRLICYKLLPSSSITSLRNDELTEKISLARDDEIACVKQQCLREYLRVNNSMSSRLDHSSINAISRRKDFSRKRINDDIERDADIYPEQKLRRVSVDGFWKEGGSFIAKLEALPTIEEAAQLYGFAQAVREKFK